MFSKAPIKRFNDTTDKNPPPGAYDPKFKTNVADYSKGPNFERQIITSTHGFATGGSQSGSRNSSRSGSRSGSQKGSRRVTPATSSAKVISGSSLERTESIKVIQKQPPPISLQSQQKMMTLLVQQTPGELLKDIQEPSKRTKYLKSDPQHRLVQQSTVSTNTDSVQIPPSTSDLTPNPEGLRDRIETLERRLSLEMEKFHHLKEQSSEYKNQLDILQLKNQKLETSSVSTCTDHDFEQEIAQLHASQLILNERMDQVAAQNEELKAARDSYRTQLDANKLSLDEANTHAQEINFLREKLDECESNWRAAEDKCQFIIREMDECNRTILENSPASRESLLHKEIARLKDGLERERQRNDELSSKCEYLDKLCLASKHEWNRKEEELKLVLKQKEDEIALLTTAVGVSVKNVGEKKSKKSQKKYCAEKDVERILGDKNGNFSHALDSQVFSPPYPLESEEAFQVSPTLFVSSLGKKKSGTNLATPFHGNLLPNTKESFLVKEREVIRKGMSNLTSGRFTVKDLNKFDAANNAAERRRESLVSENERLKEIIQLHNSSKADIESCTLTEVDKVSKANSEESQTGIKFIKRKRILPGNSEDLDVDPFEFRRTDLLEECLSSVEEIPFLQPEDSTSDGICDVFSVLNS